MERIDKILWALATAAFVVAAAPIVDCRRKSHIDYGPSVEGSTFSLGPVYAKGLARTSDGKIRILGNSGTAVFDPATGITKREWELPSDNALWATSASGISLLQQAGKVILIDADGKELSRLTYTKDQTPIFRTLSPNGKYYGLLFPDYRFSVHLAESSEEVLTSGAHDAWLAIANDGTVLAAHKGGIVFRPDGSQLPLRTSSAGNCRLSDDGQFVLKLDGGQFSVIRTSDAARVFSATFENNAYGTTRGDLVFVSSTRLIPGVLYDPEQPYGFILNLKTMRRQGGEIKLSPDSTVTSATFSLDGKWLVVRDGQVRGATVIDATTGRHAWQTGFDTTGSSPSMLVTGDKIFYSEGTEIVVTKHP